MYVDLDAYLDELLQTLGPDSKLWAAAQRAVIDFPDLQAWLDEDWGIRLCSKAVNAQATDVDKKYRTEAGILEVSPFIVSNGIRVYSDPPCFNVARQNAEGFGDVPYEDWVEQLEEQKLSIKTLRDIKWHLAAHRPVNYSGEAV